MAEQQDPRVLAAIQAEKKASQPIIQKRMIQNTGATIGETNRALNALAQRRTQFSEPQALSPQQQSSVSNILQATGLSSDGKLGVASTGDASTGGQQTSGLNVGSTGRDMLNADESQSGLDVSSTADSLYVDPTPIFDPTFDFIQEQRNQANQRYAQNKADIANIFGRLTTMRQEDAERIRSQYEQSMENRQQALAQRTAEARTAQEGAQTAAEAASAELGSGPTPTTPAASETARAAEEGIARANAYQGIWENVQGTMQQQAQTDLANAIAGYGYQELASVRDLQDSLQNTLNELAGQEATAKTSLNEAIFGEKSKVAEANYNEKMAEIAAEEARRLASIKGYWDAEEARIDAAAALAEQEANANSRVINYPDTFAGSVQFLRNSGMTPEEISKWTATLDNPALDLTTAINAEDAMARWINSQLGQEVSAAERAAARLYFDGRRYDTDINDVLGDYGVETPQ
jgi:hypothetical protein